MSEIVAWVRGHLLPNEDCSFVSDDGGPLDLSMGDAAVRASLCVSMSDDLASRRGTVLPVLVDHGGGAVGEVLEVSESGRGLDVTLGLYASGVSVWHGETTREYVSGGFMFGSGLRTARLVEVSLTATPQFRCGQEKIAVCDRPREILFAANETIVYRLLASESVPAGEPNMTPEELAAAVEAAVKAQVEAALAPVLERLAALEGGAEVVDDDAAEMADSPPAGDEASEDVAVAASELAKLKAENAALRVKAAMRSPGFVPSGRVQGATRLDRLAEIAKTGGNLSEV